MYSITGFVYGIYKIWVPYEHSLRIDSFFLINLLLNNIYQNMLLIRVFIKIDKGINKEERQEGSKRDIAISRKCPMKKMTK